MPPPDHHYCQDDFTGNGYLAHAPASAFRQLSQETQDKYAQSRHAGCPEDEPSRRNRPDIHGVISLTPLSLSPRDRSWPIRSASASSAAVANGHRPAAITTNGSAGAPSLHPPARENSSPFSACRCAPASPPFSPPAPDTKT